MAWLAHHSAAGSPARQAFIIEFAQLNFNLPSFCEPNPRRRENAAANQNGPEIRNYTYSYFNSLTLYKDESEIRRETR
jgi:hypothetical protein